MNPFNYIKKWHHTELMNPNPRMTALASGDRYTVTFEVDKGLFDLFCETGADNRRGMILEAFFRVTESPRPIGECDESGELIAEASVREVEAQRKKGGPLARLAGQWLKMPAFHRFVADTLNRPDDEVNAELCDWFIKSLCAVESKVDLDHNEAAAKRFHEEIRRPFWAYSTALEGAA